ncbi:uncharacterized protein BT62DRAFT_1009372 [Guyanagaster necrorhizus]|uniref:Uncharacterized protein n=1 Tax=Guyanagaster necrorhizus TaxID=856835 RepID=A0A9P8APC5_9AGAR|nr:uncharacterized protein BT62DRAFT_1009372 [Guyanagaster necrorhizus MCA 3950]KAG7443193.1 hypothetical protein BT62DRAFT_1009372 [Guyanagaster necrorhizus MCA 3950]
MPVASSAPPIVLRSSCFSSYGYYTSPAFHPVIPDLPNPGLTRANSPIHEGKNTSKFRPSPAVNLNVLTRKLPESLSQKLDPTRRTRVDHLATCDSTFTAPPRIFVSQYKYLWKEIPFTREGFGGADITGGDSFPTIQDKGSRRCGVSFFLMFCAELVDQFCIRQEVFFSTTEGKRKSGAIRSLKTRYPIQTACGLAGR